MGQLESYFYSFMLNFKKVGEFCFVCLVNFEEKKKLPIEPKLVAGVGGDKQCLLSPFPTNPNPEKHQPILGVPESFSGRHQQTPWSLTRGWRYWGSGNSQQTNGQQKYNGKGKEPHFCGSMSGSHGQNCRGGDSGLALLLGIPLSEEEENGTAASGQT